MYQLWGPSLYSALSQWELDPIKLACNKPAVLVTAPIAMQHSRNCTDPERDDQAEWASIAWKIRDGRPAEGGYQSQY